MNRREFVSGVAAATLNLRQSPEELRPGKQAPQGGKGIARFGDRRDWFFEKRFGLFVHWGLYAIPAWHEQHQWRARVPRAEFVKLAARWNPTRFNPDGWLDLMGSVGMKYICITTKHHDGFCLWDTRQPKFNAMNTPYRRDIIGMLAEACHRRNAPLCFYYSIADWNHPNYPNEGRHHELAGPEPGDQPDWDKYLEFLKAQVRELCTNYGEIHGFWWDMNVPQHRDPSINQIVRKLQPGAVVNNRGFDEGDFGTPERDYDGAGAEAGGFERATEACQSVGMESWGYRKDEDYYTDRHLIRSIDRYLARDANYLLNVGPTAKGLIPARSSSILRRIGDWYRAARESFEGVEPASALTSNRNVLLTGRDRTLYVHLNRDPVGDGVKLKPFTRPPERAIKERRKMKSWTLVLGLLIAGTASLSFQDAFKPLRGPYMGQQASSVAQIFLPGKISTGSNEGSSCFFPGAQAFLWKSDIGGHDWLLLLEDKEGRWQPPRPVSFFEVATPVRDFAVAPAGNWIYFSSEKSTPGLEGGNIWRARLESGTWQDVGVLGPAVNSNFDEGHASATRNGDLYFFRRDPVTPSNSDLYAAASAGEGFQSAVRLDSPPNSPYSDSDPFVAPGGDYLIFASRRAGGYGEGDLYVTFRSSGGLWSEPVNLGPQVNSAADEMRPSVTSEGRYFFFVSNRRQNPKLPPGVPPARSMPGNGSYDIYWMTADFIDKLVTRSASVTRR